MIDRLPYPNLIFHKHFFFKDIHIQIFYLKLILIFRHQDWHVEATTRSWLMQAANETKESQQFAVRF